MIVERAAGPATSEEPLLNAALANCPPQADVLALADHGRSPLPTLYQIQISRDVLPPNFLALLRR